MLYGCFNSRLNVWTSLQRRWHIKLYEKTSHYVGRFRLYNGHESMTHSAVCSLQVYFTLDAGRRRSTRDLWVVDARGPTYVIGVR